MNKVMVLAGKEFKGYFSSWLAYIFIACFVLASLTFFFFVEKFLGAGRADVRGFFAWVPITLAFLVPGLTMRQWARENEMGSIELLMTLPASTAELVCGKFLGTLGLVAVALAFTLGVPITAEVLGDLDWGPVFGGYFAALLVGAAYVAIGLFVSTWFSDQFMALLIGWVTCGVLGMMSHEIVLGWMVEWPQWIPDSLSFFGFWGHFKAIERGVLDLRDIIFYLCATGMFLFLNVCRLRFMRWA